MNNRSKLIIVALVILSLTSIAFSDTLVLKNGLKLQGIYKGGSESTIKFETSGAVQELAITEIASLAIDRPAEADASSAAPAAVKKIPAGTKMVVKTKEPVSTASHQQGSKFKAELEQDLLVNGLVVAPKGTEVYGVVLESIGGRRIGTQRIVVSFDQIVINGKPVAIDTDDVGAEGGRGGAARAIGAGALIGAAAGDAGKGAAVGAGLALLAGGKHIQVPPNSIVEVSLKQDVPLE